jgi:hypothetical protein
MRDDYENFFDFVEFEVEVEDVERRYIDWIIH